MGAEHLPRLTEEQLAELEEKYQPFQPKPCPVCGEPLAISDTGGSFSTTTWACSSDAASLLKAKGRAESDRARAHYERSRTREPIGRRGDRQVIALIGEVRRLRGQAR